MENNEQQVEQTGQVGHETAPETTAAEVEVTSAKDPVQEEAAEKSMARCTLAAPILGVAKRWNDTAETALFLNDTEKNTRQVMGNLPNINPVAPEDEENVADAIQQSAAFHPKYDQLVRTIERNMADWRQIIESDGRQLHASKPSFKEGGRKLTGEKGMMHARALLGFGSQFQAPLWHSGFWVTFKAPGLAAQLELERRIAEEKVALGRRTQGFIFSNNSVFFNNWLIDFALDHVFDTTLKDNGDLKKKISILDVPALIWGLACAMWPDGFQYARAVLVEAEDGSKTIEHRKGLVNVSRMQLTDYRSLTKAQIRHMSNNRNKDMTDDSLRTYREEFQKIDGGPMVNKTVTLSDEERGYSVQLELKTPTIDAYLNSGTKWVNNIVTMIDQAFNLPPNDPKRNRFIDENGKATHFRQYAHLINSITLVDGSFADGPDDIDDLLDVMSEGSVLSKAYFEQSVDFLENSTISVIGVPVETKDDDEKTMPRLAKVLPIDVASTFFILLGQKMALTKMRL